MLGSLGLCIPSLLFIQQRVGGGAVVGVGADDERLLVTGQAFDLRPAVTVDREPELQQQAGRVRAEAMGVSIQGCR